ncbi:2-dehydro-3-deoxygalactonokinase [Pseudoruegeria sp. SK021]|uniref:2-dehydro-3-deoxygalactonokinase n=1 Tax=Pseudoruegeria sp. SK021 TaxID=1933035 RepID=UPI000A239F20|nr:2-dehydro-3-deoxygalactonokinase [Pseudoruegeria sp. SK021]OSP56346.1 2-keto-3-deoxy-galactonokinase [Pseudoruegeria sp. SK021]
MNRPDHHPDWIAVDWGTTHLRAFAMDATGAVLAEASSDKGMGSLDRAGFEPALSDLITPWLTDAPMPIIACGMVGSRQGWVEAPYASTPCPPLSPDMVHPEVTDARLQVSIIPGILQAAPADVMRGEETQIAGYLALNPGYTGVICLPGTHTKWVEIIAGRITRFQTVMTGDMFAALSQHTVLRHTVQSKGWDEPAFLHALSQTLSQPESLPARLFGLRADHLLNGLTPDAAVSRLSGYLIGCELAATREYWLGQNVALIGDGRLTALYAAALANQGAPAEIADGNTTVIAGLTAAYQSLKGSPQ